MRVVVTFFFSAVLVACTSSSQYYYWGEYEDLLLDMYTHGDKAAPSVQLVQLQKDIAQAESINKPIAPGVYAHLGLMYYLVGDAANARWALAQEAEHYPASQRFIDGMLQRLFISTQIRKEP